MDQRDPGRLLAELRFPAFIFCVGPRVIKVMHEKKLHIVKEIEYLKYHDYVFYLNQTPFNRAFS